MSNFYSQTNQDSIKSPKLFPDNYQDQEGGDGGDDDGINGGGGGGL